MASAPINIGNLNSWLGRHIVTIAALLAFLFMAMVVVQQGRVIATQRTLIQTIFGDTMALNRLRTLVTKDREERAHAETKAPPAAPVNPELRHR